MALVSIAKAARLASVSRTTIYRKLNSGELSKSGNSIDTSELIRVFGKLKAESEQKRDSVPSVQVEQGVQNQLLQQKIDFLTQQTASQEQEITFLRGQVDKLSGVLSLEHKPDTKEKSEYSEQYEAEQSALQEKVKRLERKEPLLIKAIKAWRKP